MDLKPGDRLKLREEIVAEVTQNMDDGMWVEVKYLESREGSDVGLIELCHAQDIVSVLSTSAST
ncbi:hypothetical protein DCG74_37165 [Bradyrhizobium sp. WBAH42]|nr:hypothetical protein [Bradyrhizobium sp. WBAH30]MDD1545788.1 hypothetical protein [Bradyrhizobium sp. WBAH41]MDD1558951.1 hypothetical protein [Bradyrhizobium sp. WBAH23]MDD1566399.1 hypothetical protein [Bradyrhizobium sp. WBAH33]MDD1591992.1 hypothetical protein [Bradyrhizobium sp. WBAH42]NRB90070.1 hypothetical protein [Bradyrhizobium sp. WBAH10]QCJ94368.1 hypothetical protein DAA57_34505 [Bradyrhizobium yuanmingense]